MVKFMFNNIKNASTSYTFFELNYGYHPHMSYEEDINSWSKFKTVDKLLTELWELILVCCNNLFHAQEIWKQVYDKAMKLRSYAPVDKVWLNTKFIKTKKKQKLEAKLFIPFRVSYLMRKQAYKLKLFKKLKIYDVFYMSLLEKNTIRKRRVEDIYLELEAGNSKEYKVEAI